MSAGHGLSEEQLVEIRRLFHLGYTKRQFLEAVGADAWQFEEARRPGSSDRAPGPLNDLPSMQGRRSDLCGGGGLRLFVDKPTADIVREVEERRRQVEAGWDASTRQSRQGLPNDRTAWDAQGFAPCPARGAVPVRFPGQRAR